MIPGQFEPEHEKPTAEFIFDSNGLWVDPDSDDNPDDHAVLHHDAGTQVSFVVWNAGTGKGSATVTTYVDDVEVQTWVSVRWSRGRARASTATASCTGAAGTRTGATSSALW